MANEDAVLSVSLRMDDEMNNGLLMARSQADTLINSGPIGSAVEAERANDDLRAVIARKKQVVEWRSKFVAPAQQIINSARELFAAPIGALEAAEMHIKSRLMSWTQREARRIADEQRAAQAEAQRIRDRAQAEAAAVQARAEQEAAQRRRIAEEAEEARRKAESEGNTRLAAANAAKAARALAEAQARMDEGDRRAQMAHLVAAAQAGALDQAVVAVPVMPTGFTTRKNWVAAVAPGFSEESAKQAIIAAIAAGRSDLSALLVLDMRAATKLARALEGNFSVPGLYACNAPIASSRRAAS